MEAKMFKKAREALNLTRAQLSERSGLDVSYIFRIERGERIGTPDALDRLCDALEFTPEERSDALRLAAETSRAREIAITTPTEEVSTPADTVTAA